MQTFVISCGKCDGTRKVQIHQTPMGDRIDWLEDKQDGSFTIISGRKRLDDKFGWQCVCGNNDLLTEQERRTFANPASPDPQEINQIVKNLQPDKPKFIMRTA